MTAGSLPRRVQNAVRPTRRRAHSTRVEHADDPWMSKSGRDLDLAEEALCPDRHREFGDEHFNCNVAIVLEVARQVHGSHAPTTELPLEDIASGERGLEARERSVRACNNHCGQLGRRKGERLA
jgi:hypothetical protein